MNSTFYYESADKGLPLSEQPTTLWHRHYYLEYIFVVH